jgi:hypothetical protein
VSASRARPAPRHHESTPARPARCPCGADILAAVDEGLQVRLDPTPLPYAGAELAVRLSGRDTFDQFANGEVAYRDEHRIKHREFPVLAQHRCEAK